MHQAAPEDDGVQVLSLEWPQQCSQSYLPAAVRRTLQPCDAQTQGSGSPTTKPAVLRSTGCFSRLCWVLVNTRQAPFHAYPDPVQVEHLAALQPGCLNIYCRLPMLLRGLVGEL